MPGPVTLQNSYSLVSRNVDNDLAEALFREHMSLLAYSPLAGGMLSWQVPRTAPAGPTPASRCSTRWARAFASRMSAKRSRPTRPLAQGSGLTLVQLALGYVQSRWFLGASIIGATTMAQLREDIAARADPARRRYANRDRRDPAHHPNPAG